MRAEGLLPGLQRLVDPGTDVRGRRAQPFETAGHRVGGERARLVEPCSRFVLRLARNVETARDSVLLVEPPGADRVPVEPLVAEVVEQVVEEAKRRIGR